VYTSVLINPFINAHKQYGHQTKHNESLKIVIPFTRYCC